MEYLGTKIADTNIATLGDVRSDVYVTTFGIPTYLSWSSSSSVLNICGCDALTDDCELRLFRYKRRRNGSLQGRTRHHGWKDCTTDIDKTRRFRIIGNGDVRAIAAVTSVDGTLTYISPADYQMSRNDKSLSLSYRCAFAIFKDGQRVSDMMHFTVDKFGVYGSW